jgi:hypothetical protein
MVARYHLVRNADDVMASMEERLGVFQEDLRTINEEIRILQENV